MYTNLDSLYDLSPEEQERLVDYIESKFVPLFGMPFYDDTKYMIKCIKDEIHDFILSNYNLVIVRPLDIIFYANGGGELSIDFYVKKRFDYICL